MSDLFKRAPFGNDKSETVVRPSDLDTGRHGGRDSRIVKQETRTPTEIRPFAFQELKQAGAGDYGTVKRKMGPLAATDTDHVGRTRKDSRFALNSVVRENLAVDQEERRAIDQQVQVRLTELGEAARQDGLEQGYQEGLKKGHQEGFAKFQREGMDRAIRLESMLAEIEGAKAAILAANERIVSEAVFAIARKVLLREIAQDSDYVLRLAKKLILDLGLRDNFRIRIHPEEMKSLEMIRSGLEKEFGVLKNVTVEASPDIELGGCMIETSLASIDASIETQLTSLHDAMVGTSEPLA